MRLFRQMFEWWERKPPPRDVQSSPAVNVQASLDWSKVMTDVDALLNNFSAQISERKLCLFACACCRHVAILRKDSRMLDAVELAEQRVDTGSGLTKLMARLRTAGLPPVELTDYGEHGPLPAIAGQPRGAMPRREVVTVQQVAWHLARALQNDGVQSDWSSIREVQVSLLYDLIGHLARPSAIVSSWMTSHEGTVPKMARTIYEEGQFHDLPILADALADAGCDDQNLLSHCREHPQHIRGCWVIDTILGKE
jgi:hypothetical protein